MCVRGNSGRRVERKVVRRGSERVHGREMCVQAGVYERCSFTMNQRYRANYSPNDVRSESARYLRESCDYPEFTPDDDVT